MRIPTRSAFALLLAVAGCGDTTVTSNADLSGPDLTLGAEDLSGTQPVVATTAVVTTSSENFMGGQGALNAVRLSDQSVTKNIDTTLDVDNVVRAAGGIVYVLDRTHGSLRIYDPAKGYANPVEIVTGDATATHDFSDPADVYPIPATTKLYVALYGNDAAHAVGVIDTSKPGMGVVKWIAIPAAGSPKPRPAGFWFCGPLVYVALQDLDDSFKVTGAGRIVAIDPGTDAVAANPGTIQLMGTDPGVGTGGSGFSAVTGCDQVLVANAGDFSQSDLTKSNAGIERVDLTAGKSDGFVLTGSDLAGTPNSVSVASTTLAYAVVNNPVDFTQKVVAFNPTTKKTIGDATAPAATISFAAVTPTGQIYIGVASGNAMMGQLAEGLYVGPADGSKIASQPIDLGQAPYSISFF